MIVLDASLTIEILLRTSVGVAAAVAIAEAGEPICAPDILTLEVLQVLRRLSLSGTIEVAQAKAALERFQQMPVSTYPHRPLASRIWALRQNVTSYDAAYIALAEQLDATLWTHDRKMLSVPGITVQVELR